MPVRKRFGQHFLHDPGVIRRIIDAVAPAAGERIVEIGPGRGALTWGPAAARAHSLDVIEIDRDLAQSLRLDTRAAGGLRVHVENALETDFKRLARRRRTAAHRRQSSLQHFDAAAVSSAVAARSASPDMHFMLQKEVVERMTAQPANKTYGRLDGHARGGRRGRTFVRCRSRRISTAAQGLVRHRAPASPRFSPRFDVGDDGVLRTLVTAAFSHRRKTLRNGLKGLLTPQEIESCGIDPQLRPEALAPAQFGLLAAHRSRLYSNANGGL